MKSGQDGFVRDPADRRGAVAIHDGEACPAPTDQCRENFGRAGSGVNHDGLLDKVLHGRRRVGVVVGEGHVFRCEASAVAAVGGDDRKHRQGAVGQCGRGGVESRVVAQCFKCRQGDVACGEGGRLPYRRVEVDAASPQLRGVDGVSRQQASGSGRSRSRRTTMSTRIRPATACRSTSPIAEASSLRRSSFT